MVDKPRPYKEFLHNLQGPHCTGKTGKMAQKIPRLGKPREFGNVAKHRDFWFAQVVNSLILKIQDIAIF